MPGEVKGGLSKGREGERERKGGKEGKTRWTMDVRKVDEGADKCLLAKQ